MLGPEATLGRGFSITMDEKGKVLRSVQKLKRGTHLRTRLADGELESQSFGFRPPIPQANARLMHRDSYCRGRDEASRQHRRHRKNWAPPANLRLQRPAWLMVT